MSFMQETIKQTQKNWDGICYIVSAGDNYGIDFTPREEDFVIAVDGGLCHLEQAKIKPNLIIGDFDSLGSKPNLPNVIALNSEKDDTDTFAAVREGIKKGYECFHFYACTGGRIEHTIANIQTLAYLAQNNMRGFLFDRDNIMTAVTNGTLSFPPYNDGFISVFSLSDKSNGVFEKGFKYGLNNADLTNTFPIGVSNEFIGKQGEITVGSGTLLIIFPLKCREDVFYL